MRSRTPDTGRDGATGEDPLSAELATAVLGARRRAARDGERQADTAHLLHTLLEADPAARQAFEGGPAQVARLLGYLVQRTIGYGLRWSGTVEDSGALPSLAGSPVPGWSPAAAGAMREARARAAARGAAEVAGTDLLAALVRDSRCRAVEVLRRAGVDPVALGARLDDPARWSAAEPFWPRASSPAGSFVHRPLRPRAPAESGCPVAAGPPRVPIMPTTAVLPPPAA